MAQTYEDFLKTVRANQLGADGRFLGPQSGTAYYAEGLTPEQFYKRHLNDQKPTGRFGGAGDNMEAEMESAGPVSADWVEGPKGNRGLFGGVSDMMTNPKTLMGLLAMGGIGALTGFGGAGAAAGGTAGGGAAGAAADFGAGTYAAGGAGDIAAFNANQIAALSPGATSGFTGSMAMPELAASMPAGVTEFASMIPGAAEAGTEFLTPAGTLGGATTAGGAMIGNESAAETARLASMNAGTNTLGGISPGSAIGSSSMLDTAGQWIKDNPTLAKLGGGLIGAIGGAAASGDKTTSASSSRDPWSQAQPYLIDNLKTNAAMQEHYRANPFSDLQKQQYQGLFNSLANSQANIPGLLANASSFGKSIRGQMPAMQGLLSGTQATPIDWNQYANIGRKG